MRAVTMTATETLTHFSPDWVGVEGIFGGRGIATAVEAATHTPEVEGLVLASASLEFSGGLSVGGAEVVTDVVHRGRSTATVQVTVVQGRPRLRATAKLVAPGERRVLGPHVLPQGPGPDELDDFDAPYGRLAYDDKFRVRVVSHAEEAGVPTTRAWVRLQSGSGLGAGGAEAALLDVMPPSLFLHQPQPKFVPTVDFAMHLDALTPAVEGEWLYAVMRTEWATDTFCLETATLHRPDGRFVARGTQSRRIVW